MAIVLARTLSNANCICASLACIAAFSISRYLVCRKAQTLLKAFE